MLSFSLVLPDIGGLVFEMFSPAASIRRASFPPPSCFLSGFFSCVVVLDLSVWRWDAWRRGSAQQFFFWVSADRVFLPWAGLAGPLGELRSPVSSLPSLFFCVWTITRRIPYPNPAVPFSFFVLFFLNGSFSLIKQGMRWIFPFSSGTRWEFVSPSLSMFKAAEEMNLASFCHCLLDHIPVQVS